MPVPNLYPAATLGDRLGRLQVNNTQNVDPLGYLSSLAGMFLSPLTQKACAITGRLAELSIACRCKRHHSKNNLNPTGLSVVDFLAAQSIRGVSKLGIPAQNYNIWGQSQTNPVSGSMKSYAGAGGADSSLNVAIPLTARSWAFQLDVSTDLVDTVVIQQNYVHVVIDSFTVDRDTVSSGDSAIVTATLRNTNSFSGLAMQGFSLPANSATSCQITGGGGLYFEPNETQTVNLLITNTGNLVNDTKADFTYSVMNTHGDTTLQRLSL